MPTETPKKKKPTSLPAAVRAHVPTAVDAWSDAPQDDQGFITELPSGNLARVRRTLDLPILLKSGQIPNPLSKIVRKMMDEGDPVFPVNEMTSKVSEQLLELIHSTTCRVMVSPKVSRPPAQERDEDWDDYSARIEGWEADPGTLSIYKVSMDDQFFLFAVAQGMAADLASFRAEQSATLVAVQAGESLGNAAERVGGRSAGKRTRPSATKRTGGGSKKK